MPILLRGSLLEFWCNDIPQNTCISSSLSTCSVHDPGSYGRMRTTVAHTVICLFRVLRLLASRVQGFQPDDDDDDPLSVPLAFSHSSNSYCALRHYTLSQRNILPSCALSSLHHLTQQSSKNRKFIFVR